MCAARGVNFASVAPHVVRRASDRLRFGLVLRKSAGNRAGSAGEDNGEEATENRGRKGKFGFHRGPLLTGNFADGGIRAVRPGKSLRRKEWGVKEEVMHRGREGKQKEGASRNHPRMENWEIEAPAMT